MKILHVINTLRTGGAEKLVSQIVPLLKDQGHEVDVFVFDGKMTYFRQQLENHGIKVLSYREGCNVYNPLIIFKLVRLMSGYDIVHTHNTSPQLFAALSSVFGKKSLVTTEHSTTNRRRGNRLLRFIDKWMYSRYDKIICISQEAERLLGNYTPSTRPRLVTIHNGINVSQFTNSLRPMRKSSSKSKFVITMVARFSYQKDHQTVLKAFSHLDKERYELWFVGDGVNRHSIEWTIGQLGLQQNVRLLGIRNDIPSVLHDSDVVLQISVIEGFGLAAVEGMASGKPVIASDIPGLAEVVSGAGILVEPKNDLELAEAIKKLAEDSVFYDTVAENCQKRAADFDIKRMAEKYNRVYETLT